MGSTEPAGFADDAAKTNPWTEDALGFAPFARRLSQVVLSMAAPNGYVIGLHGAWGAGKTTALNFTRAYIERHNVEAPEDAAPLEIIEFRPWLVSGQRDLIEAFFKVLSEALDDSTHRQQRTKKRWLGRAKAVADPVVDAAAALGTALHPNDGPGIKASAAFTKATTKNVIDAWLAEPSLQKAYQELIARLDASQRRFLVIIDDIDRLQPDEIRSVMQMVKSIGRLPRTIYLLSYDRRIVWSALEPRAAPESGEPTFMEKIVQHELELPLAGRSALLRLLDQNIGFVTGEAADGGMRWFEIVRNGIYRWIRAPRDVFRFANALQFAWPPLKGEVDPLDLVAMEGLRIFDPTVFDLVRSNRDFLMSDGAWRMASEDRQTANGERIREALPPKQREEILALLVALFPTRGKILSARNRWFGGEAWWQVVKRRGIATPQGFDAYFSLFPSINAVPKSDIDAAAAAPDDLETQRRLLAKALAAKDENGRTLVGSYFGELQYRLIGTPEFMPGKAMLDAVLEKGEQIMAFEHNEAFELSPDAQWGLLIRDILKVVGTARGALAADELMVGAGLAVTSASVAADLYVDRARELDVLPRRGSNAEPLISLSALEQLGARTLELIEGEARDGLLARTPVPWAVLHAWRHLAADGAREWLAATIATDPKFLVRLALGLLGRSLGERKRTYSFHERPDAAEYDLAGLLAACEAFAESPVLDEDERARLAVLAEGLRRRSEGASPDPEDED